MKPDELASRLHQAKKAVDFIQDAEFIVQDLISSEAGLEAVPVLLRFIEENPKIDFGTPGPLVHFAERFYGKGYEAELLASLSRKPTPHTVWMLNRIINGTKQLGERERLIKVLRDAAHHPSADNEVRALVARFLE